jgi:hypothetical protein
MERPQREAPGRSAPKDRLINLLVQETSGDKNYLGCCLAGDIRWCASLFERSWLSKMTQLLLGQSTVFLLDDVSLIGGRFTGVGLRQEVCRGRILRLISSRCYLILWHAHEDDPYSRIGIDMMDFGFDRRPDVGFCVQED